eukprot:436399_1
MLAVQSADDQPSISQRISAPDGCRVTVPNKYHPLDGRTDEDQDHHHREAFPDPLIMLPGDPKRLDIEFDDFKPQSTDELKFPNNPLRQAPWKRPYLRSGKPVLAFKSEKLTTYITGLLGKSLGIQGSNATFKSAFDAFLAEDMNISVYLCG